MFKRKYIFELRRTKYLRYTRGTLLLSLISFSIYSVFCGIFVAYSEGQNDQANLAFSNKQPDLIVVFTGDLGRIPFALKKAQEFKNSKIFITGVHNKTTINSILYPQNLEKKINPEKLEIDYLARNTVENVISTLRYIQKKGHMNSILIVSHDYHIVRIKLILETLAPKNEGYQFFYSGVKTDYLKWRNLKILYKEAFKLLRTFGFLMIWDPETSV